MTWREQLQPWELFRDAIQPTALAVTWCAVLHQLMYFDIHGSAFASSNAASPEAQQRWKDFDWLALRVLGSLGTVTGMLLAFRANSSIERWNTGRRGWSDMKATSRALYRLLCAALMQDIETPSSAVIEALSLVPFFSIALMHQLREGTVDQLSVKKAFPRLALTLPASLVGRLQPYPMNETQASEIESAKKMEREKEKDMRNDRSRDASDPKRQGKNTSANAALFTLQILQKYLDEFSRGEQLGNMPKANGAPDVVAPKLAGPIYAHSIGLLNSLNAQMTDLERVRDTPIPLSLSLHFSRLLFVNTALLPFVLVHNLPEDPLLCMAATALVTAMLYGIDSVSATLSQPFGTDREDLPLERWCREIEQECAEIRESFT